MSGAGAREIPLGLRMKRWAYERLVIGSLEGLSRALRYWPPWYPEANGVEVIGDVHYLDDDYRDHTLDIYRPAGANRPLPVAFYVHGGGFQFFDKDTHWSMADTLARAGFLTFNINYRRAPKHPYPAAFEDAAAALIWVLEHAGYHGGDLSRMVWAGESAGANLVLALTLAACWPSDDPWARMVWESRPSPRALLPACGYLQVAEPERLYRGTALPDWIIDRIHVVSDAYLPDHAEPAPEHLFANPLLFLEGAGPPVRSFPPTFALAGDKDPVLPDTVRLGPALERLGVDHEIKVYPDVGHAFHAMRWNAVARQAWADQLAFVTGRLERAPITPGG